MMRNDPSGSRWRKWDLHFHTPKSYDYRSKGLSARDLVDRLKKAEIEVVAITDHHVMDVGFIEEMRVAAGDDITVLPGIEFASYLGGKDSVHFIGIFAEDVDAAFIGTELLARSGINRQRASGRTEQQIYVDFLETAKLIRELGGLVSVHAHGKANGIEGIGNNTALKRQFKTDLLFEYVDVLEIGSQERVRDYEDIVFPSIGFKRALVVGSDDHGGGEYPSSKVCWIKADPTFAGLKMALREPGERFCLDSIPQALTKLHSNKTKYIKSISFSHLPSMPKGEAWLYGEVPLNPGLVAIIGNKGAGKSALADCIGLLGSCSTSDAFSFLVDSRFRHPKTGRAQHIEATMKWYDGEPRIRRLDEEIAPDEPERVKYLPQNFVEQVCNELATAGGGRFEDELKKVIFSKLEHADRLGMRTLDELLSFRTEEIHREARSLLSRLHQLGEERALLERRLDPSVRSNLEQRIARKREEIQSHDAAKPPEQPPPHLDPSREGVLVGDMARLSELNNEKRIVTGRIIEKEQDAANLQIKIATADKLLGKLSIISRSIQDSITDLTAEASALGLDASALVEFSIREDVVRRAKDDALAALDNIKLSIYGDSDNTVGIRRKLFDIEREIEEVQERLTKPLQEYQEYLRRKEEWERKREELIGSADDPDSLEGLESELRQLSEIPERVTEIQALQESIAMQLHELRNKEADVFRELYAPVQEFVQTHPLANEHLKLEFRVEVVDNEFVDGLLSFLNQNRAGSFYGSDDGAKVAKRLVAPVDWSNWESVLGFLRSVIEHLHFDHRPGRSNARVALSDQVKKGKDVAGLYNWLYGLTYLNNRYVLRWDGKDIAQLSPGERGTLLLIFYLLVDDSDLPLIIDQPEANLDNMTVAEKLVHCMRFARQRRQVIVVTHNPNMAVVCDADQVIHASLDRLGGNRITYETGALENPIMNKFTLNILEGGRDPFEKRDGAYKVVTA